MFSILYSAFPLSFQFSIAGFWATTGSLPSPPSQLAWRNIFRDWGWISFCLNQKQRHSLSVPSHYYNAAPSVQFSSVAQLCPTPCDTMNRHARLPCSSPTPGVHPNPCPLSRWCHATISSSVVPFSSWPQSFPASGSFQMSQLFTSGGQSTGVSTSTSVLPMNTQDWSPLGWTG